MRSGKMDTKDKWKLINGCFARIISRFPIQGILCMLTAKLTERLSMAGLSLMFQLFHTQGIQIGLSRRFTKSRNVWKTKIYRRPAMIVIIASIASPQVRRLEELSNQKQ